MSGVIHRKDLDRYMQWLGAALQVGPGIGDVYFVASDGSAFENWLQKRGGNVVNTLAAAYALTTDKRNDVICVSPEVHSVTAVVSWAKSNTHLIGLGGPNTAVPVGVTNPSNYLDLVNPATGGAAIASVLDITGEQCQFHNLSIQNLYSNASCLRAVYVRGEMNYFKNCNIVGGTAATPAATANSCSLEIGDDAGCTRFDDCVIGSPHGTKRSVAHSGVLLFSSAARRPPRGNFNRCQLHVRSDTATVSAIKDADLTGPDRSWIFTDCFFENFSDNYATLLTEVIHEGGFATTHCFFLRRCSAVGFTYWCVNQSGYPHYTLADMPITGTGGGLGIAAEGAAGA